MENGYEVKYIAEGPSSPLALLEQFATSAEGIAKFSHLVIAEVEEGRVSALKVALLMKTVEKIKDQINDTLGKHYRREAETYGEKPFAFNGAEISLADHGVKYDYSECGHPELEQLTKQIEEATAQRKVKEDLLKALKAPMEILLEGGEVVTIKPPTRKAKAGINISIK